MKHTAMAAALIAFALIPAGVANAAAIQIFNTGVDSSGGLLAAGAVDPHYTITAGPTGAESATVQYLAGTWVANTTGSQWIAPSIGNFTAGTFSYSTSFSLSSTNIAKLTGLEAADNEVTILLNGVSVFTNTNPFGFASFTPFAINSGFVVGENSLVFEVHNDQGPTGLQVQISGTTSGTVTPEPGSLLLSISGVIALWAWSFTRSRNSTKAS